jgi:cytochrome c-type protein NapB
MRPPDKGSVIVKQTSKRKPVLVALTAFAMALGTAVALSVPETSSAVAQQAGEVQSLRGEMPVPEENMAPENRRQETRAGAFSRAYRQQPPLIPHRIDGYQITRTVNQCMHCHDWPYNVQEGAPKISETHYVNREGVALDRVTPGRWFCNQCHVPQHNARELVPNEFKPATEAGN